MWVLIAIGAPVLVFLGYLFSRFTRRSAREIQMAIESRRVKRTDDDVNREDGCEGV